MKYPAKTKEKNNEPLEPFIASNHNHDAKRESKK